MKTSEKFQRWMEIDQAGLRREIVIVTLVIVVAACGLMGLLFASRMKNVLQQDLEAQGQSLGVSLARSAREIMVNKDNKGAVALQDLVDESAKLPGVAYVYVTNVKAEMLAHTFKNSVPLALVTGNLVSEDETKLQLKPLEMDDIRALDVAAPIFQPVSGVHYGAVHVGMDLYQVGSRRFALFRDGALVLFIVLAFGVVILNMTLSREFRPLVQLTMSMERAAEHGDFSRAVKVQKADEIGRLAGYFAKLAEKVQSVPAGLGETVARLDEAIAGLAENAGMQDARIRKQAAALQDAQVTAEEIRRTSEVAAVRAKEVLRLAVQAGETSQAGEGLVEQSVARFVEIREQVVEISKQMAQLEFNTQRIMEIVGTVKDFADQSDILALNAGIEAMRAGEHGKGFGLVAREVRSLADQSLRATQRVNEVMSQVDHSITQAVKSTKTGQERVERGLTEVKKSGEALQALAALSRTNADKVGIIVAAVEEQNTGIERIFTAVSNQNAMMTETSQSLYKTQMSLATLRVIFETLNSVVQTYKA